MSTLSSLGVVLLVVIGVITVWSIPIVAIGRHGRRQHKEPVEEKKELCKRDIIWITTALTISIAVLPWVTIGVTKGEITFDWVVNGVSGVIRWLLANW